MDSLPPYFNTGIFNTSAFYTEKDYLTKEEADKLYLSVNLSGNFIALSGVTAGIVSENKAVIVDSNKDITGFNSLTTNELIVLNGASIESGHLTLSASSHIKINSLSDYSATIDASIYSKGGIYIEKSIQSLGVYTNSITLNGTAITATANEINYLDITTGAGTAEASKALVLDANRDITNIRNLTATNLTGTLQTASQPNITSVGTLTSLSTNSLTLNGTQITSTASELNVLDGITATTSELNYLDLTTGVGTAEANKALVLDANRDITNIRNLTTTNVTFNRTGTGNILESTVGNSTFSIQHVLNAHMNIGTGGTSTANHINFRTQNTNRLSILYNGNIGINNSTPLYSLDVAGDINLTGSLLLNGTAITATATEINYLDITTIGVAQDSKALVLDSSRNINNINALSATSITVNEMQNSNLSQPVVFNANSNVWTIIGTNGVIRAGIASNGWLGTQTNHDLILASNNTTRMTISSTGNISIANVASGYQLNLGNTGTGINTASLKFNDVTFNQDLYLNITSGSVEANKALVPNSDLDLGTFRNVTLNGTLTANNVTVANNISVKNIALNNTTNYRTILDCGATANDRILGLFNNGTVFYGFGANSSMIRILSGGGNGTGFYSLSTPTSLGNLDVAITSTALDIKTKLQINATDVIDNSRNLQNIVDINMSGKFYDSNNYEWLTGTTLLMRLETNGRLSLGTNTDSAGRDLSILNTNSNAGFRIGAANTNGNCCTIQYTYVGNNDNSNKYSIDFFGKSNQFCLLNSGNCGIGTGSPSVALDVVGEIKATTNIRAGLNLVAGGTTSNARLTVYSADENIARFYRGSLDYVELWRNTASSYGNSWVFGSNNSNALYFETNGIVRSGVRASGEMFVGNYNGSDAGNAIFNVNASKTITLPSSYGYLNSAGNTGTISTPSAQNYSCYFTNRIWIANGEINITSDKRIKTNIQDIELNDCYELLDKVQPKTFNYKSNPDDFKQYGFIAQDILKTKIGIDIVNLTPNEEMIEEIEEDGFVNPANYNFTLEREHIIAVQFKIIQDLNKRLIKLENFLSKELKIL